jgi:peptide/nickel transport system substrate-binding protein
VLVQNLGQLPGMNARRVLTQGAGVAYLSLDLTAPQFAPVQVRRGLNFAVDRKAIVDGLFGGLAEIASQPVPKGSFGSDPNLQPLTYDENRARQLIAEGGFPSGFTMPIAFNPGTAGNQQLVEVLVPQLQRVGVRVEPQPGDPATFLARLLANQLGPVYVSTFAQGSVQDPSGWMPQLLSGPPGPGRYRNPQYDALYAQASVELDRTRRQQQLQQVMRLLMEDPPGILFWSAQGAWGVRNSIQNFEELPRNSVPQWQTMTKR